ncbi:MAG: [FeFe] hydrogenase H-cluster radical SAM maturase HydE [Lachnospiraceae bacterium]|nr:[FeFe] hydrogenase H-cluster radical SAM maturase HydE [Lachnospiraceae bacterium]
MNTILTTAIDKLVSHRPLGQEEFVAIIEGNSVELRNELSLPADRERKQYFGNRIYIRGLIEFSNYCKNNCYYCGIRCGNQALCRYRLTAEDILSCCQKGYQSGFRTFVLQSGEDPYFQDEQLAAIVSAIHWRFPDCAITLSIGERSMESYKRLFDAGASRYLLRHETADAAHYVKLHPASMSYKNRMQCLKDLKEIGYQTGCGFMVGSPFQTPEHLAKDLLFIQAFKPHMVGIGPFISHRDTPFSGCANGTLELTLLLISILRLMQPTLLLPATTALATIHPEGRDLGILAGANVVMPNLSPAHVRKDYSLYDNKSCTEAEAAESISSLKERMAQIGFQIVTDRGDTPSVF